MFNKKMIKIVSRAQYQLIFFSETLRSTGPRPLTAWASPQNYKTKRAGPRSMCECAAGARSVRSGAAILPQLIGRYEDARSCSLVLAEAPARFTSPCCFSSVDRADEDAPGLSRCACASGCPGPLLTPCFASCSSLLIGKMHNAQ